MCVDQLTLSNNQAHKLIDRGLPLVGKILMIPSEPAVKVRSRGETRSTVLPCNALYIDYMPLPMLGTLGGVHQLAARHQYSIAHQYHLLLKVMRNLCDLNGLLFRGKFRHAVPDYTYAS